MRVLVTGATGFVGPHALTSDDRVIPAYEPEDLPGAIMDAMKRQRLEGKGWRQEGIDILLNAFNEVSKKHHNVKLKLIGGKGNGSLLLEKANNKAITVLDYLPQTELVKEFQTADCFVLPSRFDSYGMVVSEALACGLPVIVSEMVGAKDIVTAGENGWIVPVGDVQALTKRMTWCVENREVLKGMQRSARNAAMDATWAAYHGRLVKCLQTFLFTGKR